MNSDELLNQFAESFESPEDLIDDDDDEVEEEPPALSTIVDESSRDTPALYAHIMKVWNAMYDESVIVTEGRAWQGRLTTLFNKVGVSSGVYSSVTHRMRSMGCISQIKRGGGGNPSTWLLHKPPTIGEFDATRHGGYLTAERKRLGEQAAQIQALVDRIARLEARVDLLIEWKIQQDFRDTQAVTKTLKDIVPHTRD